MVILPLSILVMCSSRDDKITNEPTNQPAVDNFAC